jgi:transposase
MNDGTFIPLTSVKLMKTFNVLKNQMKVFTKLNRAKLRQAFRINGNNVVKELRHSLRNIADEIVAKAISKESLLAIDGVTQSQGSFGHAELKEMLVKLCKQKKVPFVIVPSAHTSSDCSYCFERSGKYNQVARSKDFEKVSCERLWSEL